MLKKSYILNFIIDAKFNIFISVLGLGGVVFDSVWGGGNNPPTAERNTAWNKARKCFHCLGAPNNLIRPCLAQGMVQCRLRVDTVVNLPVSWQANGAEF